MAGEAIFEIGKRLKHVKENDLVHGEFGKWLERIEISWDTANRMMKIASELSLSSNYVSGRNLGIKVLYEISQFSGSEREKSHTVPSTGQTKTVDEMTVRELREVKAEESIDINFHSIIMIKFHS